MNDERLTAQVSGHGPVVVLVHGFPGGAKDFTPVRALLEDRHTVVTVDLLGFGERSAPSGSLWVDRQAAALERTLDSLTSGPVVLVGHDVGGPVVSLLAARWGERVRAVVVASCSLVGDAPVPPPFRLLRVPLLGAVVEALLFSAPALRLLARVATRGPLPVVNTPSEVRSIRRMFATALKAMARHFAPVEAAVREVKVPATFVVGEKDPFFTPPFAARMAALFPAGRLVVLPGVGHFPQLEAPAELARIITATPA